MIPLPTGSANPVELLPLPDRPGRFEHARGHQLGEHLGSDERGEPVVARRAVALDLEPVDVDVGDAPVAQRLAGPPRASGRGPGSRRSRRRRPCCRRSGGSMWKTAAWPTSRTLASGGSSASSRASGGLSHRGDRWSGASLRSPVHSLKPVRAVETYAKFVTIATAKISHEQDRPCPARASSRPPGPPGRPGRARAAARSGRAGG